MVDSAALRHGLPKAFALLMVLVITTGWAQSAAPLERSVAGQAAGAAATATVAASTGRTADQLDEAGFAGIRTGSKVPVSGPGFSSVIRFHEHAPGLARASIVPTESAVSAGHPRSFSGQNRFWIPTLGLSYPVQLYACTRKRPPDNFMYRWGCAGTNNVYILGHAWGVMKPLHDAFVVGRLHVGMVALYADGSGRIHSYRVTEWRVVDPVDSGWAIASQSDPSMTLQTCVGKASRYRLNVRLVATD